MRRLHRSIFAGVEAVGRPRSRDPPWRPARGVVAQPFTLTPKKYRGAARHTSCFSVKGWVKAMAEAEATSARERIADAGSGELLFWQLFRTGRGVEVDALTSAPVQARTILSGWGWVAELLPLFDREFAQGMKTVLRLPATFRCWGRARGSPHRWLPFRPCTCLDC